jgi:hypothetical protein
MDKNSVGLYNAAVNLTFLSKNECLENVRAPCFLPEADLRGHRIERRRAAGGGRTRADSRNGADWGGTNA